MDGNKKKVVVVGAGVSGLSAGIYAIKYGYDAVIVERNPSVGGLCTGWNRKGSYIDGCIHWLTESDAGVLNKLWHETGALSEKVAIHHHDAYCEIDVDDDCVKFYTSLPKLRDELMRFAVSDNDKRLVKKFIWAVRLCKTNAITVHKPYHFWGFLDIIFFVRKIFSIIPVLRSFGKLNINDFASQFDSPVLKFAFGNNLCPTEYSMFSIASTYGGIVSKNSGVPIGGSKAFVERMKETFLAMGGELKLSTEAEEFVMENDHISSLKLKDGSDIVGDMYISACDLHYALDKLLGGKYRIDQLDERDAQKDRFPVFSGILLSFRTSKDLSGICSNRYIKCKPYETLGRTYETVYLKHFAYDKTLLSADGKTLVQSLITTSEEQFDMLAAMSKEDYKQYKKDVAQLLIDNLKANGIEDYGNLELLDVATPLTYTHYVNAYKGSFMTYMFTKHGKQMNIHNDVLPVDNLALAGHWMMMPGGVPVAIMQGKFAAHTLKLKSEGGQSFFGRLRDWFMS